ncbi:MAG: CTP synthase [Candidatus Aminicenantes bacterium]|nr:CTP synthase [Candidatus Aminicenantes bacterium]MDH5714606.1 CTP synthase [Candidatus Aminicenantes bacterium]
MAAKFIFVTGGVISSLGKGLASASLGCLMESHGYRVALQKLDPYLNVDPGTMSPFQHGEVYVTDDGAETDLDLGHYERFTHCRTTKDHNYTSGQVYETLILKERRGDFLGNTVQVIPHVTDEIKRVITKISHDVDIVIVEIGGTVGDIEGLPFLEAIRQLRQEVGPHNAVNIHLTLVPFIKTAEQLKTKPTQHSVKQLREIGIQPDIILCRTDRFLPPEIKAKISLFCNVSEEAVITAKDVECLYEVPLIFRQEGLDKIVLKLLNLPYHYQDLKEWEELIGSIKNPADEITIAVVGKYVRFHDSYKSLIEALKQGGYPHNLKVNIEWIEAEDIEKGTALHRLNEVDGILVPGGFGKRGVLGMIETIRYARENKVPFFGICLGMQCSVIEFARNVCHLEGADSTEFAEQTPHKVIHLLKDLEGVTDMGGTMRLGQYPCRLANPSFAYEAYQQEEVYERHRHRYELNREYEEVLANKGMRIVGESPDKRYVEIVEVADHPWFVGCQFHPEWKAKPLKPHPLYSNFIKASYSYRQRRKRSDH